MTKLFAFDWRAVLVPSVSPVEIALRGTLIYLSLFLLLRIVLKRETGQVGITDLLVVVLLADASQNAMAGEYRSVPDGILLVATIIFWNYALNWLGFRFPRIERLVHPPPLLLVDRGRLLYRNMRQEMLTESELLSFLRQQGVEDVSQVKSARMEGDGRISVVKYDGQAGDASASGRRVA